MALTLRGAIGSPLTFQQVDDNFTYLEGLVDTNTASSATNTLDIDTINTVIGDSTTRQELIDYLLPTGIIQMWSGTNLNIPTGWALCDGTNGTPNLVNKFIKASTVTQDGGGSNTIVESNLPSHTHSVSVNDHDDHTHTMAHTHTGTTDAGGSHTHSAPREAGSGTATVSWAHYTFTSGAASIGGGDHTHTMTTGQPSNASTGGVSAVLAHTVNQTPFGSATPTEFEPVNYELIFIMKV